MKIIRYIPSITVLAIGFALTSCQERMDLQEPLGFDVPKGEMAFCIGTEALGESFTKGMVTGEDNTPVSTLRLLCFDKSGYYLGIREATPVPASISQGTFSGYVPESTARIHFIANVIPDLSGFSIGTAEKVMMSSEALSTRYDDITDPSAPQLCFWGYHKESTAADMKAWLQASTPNPVSLLRDRARIQLTLSTDIYDGGWVSGGAGTGCTVTSIRWGIQNGRERGYLAPYFSPYNTGATTPWEGYESAASLTMNEYQDCDRYDLPSDGSMLDLFYPTRDNFQYVYDDSNMKTSAEKGRIRIVLEVNYTEGGTSKTKYLLALLREGSGSNQGEQVQIVRNKTYIVNVTDLSHDGYDSLDDAIDKSADDFINAPADVDIHVPYITDGKHVLNLVKVTKAGETENLIESRPVIVNRDVNQTYHVTFTYKVDTGDGELAPLASDFKILWEENINEGWTIGSLTMGASAITGTTDTYQGEFDVTIGSIGTSYALLDYLIIRHKKSGLSRNIHFYSVEDFIFQVRPVLEQVMIPPASTPGVDTPYMGPSGDDVDRPVFKLSFTLSQSLQEDLFPLTVRMTSSTLEPYGDESSSHTTRLPGGFGLLNASTAKAVSDGTSLSSAIWYYTDPRPDGSGVNHWNYQYDQWGYWYEYTLPEYPKTGGVRDGEVVVYLKDIRDAYAQASRQDAGLYLDIENFEPYGLYVPADDIVYPIYAYNEGGYAGSGEYRVGNMAQKYRASITGAPDGTYTLSKVNTGNGTDWLTISESVTSHNGQLNIIFQVADNTATGSITRSADILMVNGSNTTKLTVIQDGVTSIRLRAAGTSVMGNQTGVQLTVYSDDNWTLAATAPSGIAAPQLTFADNYQPQTTPLSAGNTGSFGRSVTLILPINYTTSDITYTVTATNTTTGDDVTVDITHRGATLTNETVQFSADTDFYSTSTETRGGIRGVMSTHTLAGNAMTTPLGDPNPYRWDFKNDNNTLALTRVDESVMQIRGVIFVFHADLVPSVTLYCPDRIDASYTDLTNTHGEDSFAPTGSSVDDWTDWVWNHSSSPVKDATFTLVKGTETIALKNFTVYITRAYWK